MKLLFVGDVVGGLGRRTLAALLPAIRDAHEPDFVVVNGENAAGGVGITQKTARELLETGADAITLGNHAYRHREVYELLDREARIVRPANYPKGSPGRGHTVVERDGMRLGVVNLSGHALPRRGPLAVRRGGRGAVRAARRAPTRCSWTCTPRPRARRSRWAGTSTAASTACVGTHTHVPTADARVLPGGTAYVTDVGMTGPRGGVIGVKRELALERFLTLTNVRFETSDEDPWLNAVLVEADADGRATAIEQLLLPAEL